MFIRTLTVLSFLSIAACGSEGGIGDSCETDADCGDLHCHIEDGAGICEEEEEGEEA